MHKFNSIDEALSDLKKGKFIIVVDDEDRENEGDLIMAAEKITPEAVNFITKEARGMLCVAISASRANELDLEFMVEGNTALQSTPFTVTVDALKGTTTGISAPDRATTIKTIIDPATRPEDLARPGHIFPLISKDGGVSLRATSKSWPNEGGGNFLQVLDLSGSSRRFDPIGCGVCSDSTNSRS